MKTNLKITKKGITPLKVDGDTIKAPKLQKDRSAKRRLSIYDDFSDENPDGFENNFDDDDVDYI
ncbi:MAG TPA: hypothetical protein VGK10_16570 [Prolixibacteraceae bacterium]|jgi:hypothetical protein